MTKNVDQIASELADREAIRDCLFRYCRGIDRIDEELILSAYWPDGSDEHGNISARTPQEFVDAALPILRNMESTSHFIGNILINIQGEYADVETYIRSIHVIPKPSGERYEHHTSSRFLDRMERRDGEWRIKRRVALRDWYREFPDSFDWGESKMYGASARLEFGQPKPHDLSYELMKLA